MLQNKLHVFVSRLRYHDSGGGEIVTWKFSSRSLELQGNYSNSLTLEKYPRSKTEWEIRCRLCTFSIKCENRVFSGDVTAAMLVSQASPVGIELFSLFQQVCSDADHLGENTL